MVRQSFYYDDYLIYSVNLLETILFSGDACEALDDYALDLVDYCYRTISFLLSIQSKEKNDEWEQTPKGVFDRFTATTLIEYGNVT